MEIGEKSEQSRQLGIQSCHARMDDRLTGKEKTALGRIGCYARTLERLFGKGRVAEKRWNRPRWNEQVEDAIQGLIRVQNNEQTVKRGEAGRAETNKRRARTGTTTTTDR